MKLTDTHLVLLSAAAQHQDHLLSRPDHVNGSAAQALATKLVRAGLVHEVAVRSGQPLWREDDSARVGLRITRAGLAAIGLDESEEPFPLAPEPERDPKPGRASHAATPHQPTQAPRSGSKQAAVLDLLRREEGASLDDLMVATGWLAHTTRAALTGLRQRGYEVSRSKSEDGRTVYRIRPASEVLAFLGEEG